MKGKAIVFMVLFVLLVSVFHFGISFGAVDSLSGSGSFAVQSTIDWWPMYQHDLSHTGFSSSTAPNTNHTLWTSRPGGSFDWCSAAVVDGAVYVGDNDGWVYNLNSTTGAVTWKSMITGIVESSPAVAEDIVYVGSLSSRLFALNASTGEQIWNYTTGDNVHSSPAVAYGKVYLGSGDRNVYALNASTGERVWNYTTGDPVYSSPSVADGMVFVGSYDYNVYALDASTGVGIWSYETGDGVSSSPVVVNGTVFIGSMDGTFYAFGPEPVIPEFPSFLVLPSFMTVTLLAVLVFRRKHLSPSRE